MVVSKTHYLLDYGYACGLQNRQASMQITGTRSATRVSCASCWKKIIKRNECLQGLIERRERAAHNTGFDEGISK